MELLEQYSIFRSGTEEQRLEAAKIISAYMIQYISSNTAEKERQLDEQKGGLTYEKDTYPRN